MRPPCFLQDTGAGLLLFVNRSERALSGVFEAETPGLSGVLISVSLVSDKRLSGVVISLISCDSCCRAAMFGTVCDRLHRAMEDRG